MPQRFVRVEGGRVAVGTNEPFFKGDGEGPERIVPLAAFAVDPFAVTNRWFAEFIAGTGYVTDAERFGWSFVFQLLLADGGAQLPEVAAAPWWRQVQGACWRAPLGPSSSLEGLENHPVVHVSWNDAAAFANWAGGRLLTEAEWEHAARGGLRKAKFPWGEAEPTDTANQICNIWRGVFPERPAGPVGPMIVDSHAPNGLGLYNMCGNVWEWTADAFRIRSLAKEAKARNTAAQANNDKLMKGGSYLCHRSYCYRYRIAARSSSSADSSAGHIGFRIAFET